MPELRIILLVLGVLFVAGIAGFEWWRSRGQKPAAAMGSRGGARLDERGGVRLDERGGARIDERGSANDDRDEPPAQREKRPLPEINIVREAHISVDDDLPVIELASTSESGTRRALGISISNEVAVDLPDSHGGERGEPTARAEPPARAAPRPRNEARGETRAHDESRGETAARDETSPRAEPLPRTELPARPAPPARAEPFLAAHVELSEVRVIEEVPAQAPQIRLDWPPEKERRIVTLRVVPRAEPRFPGRALRQAFSGCGFWHGPLEIYHLPDENGRVLLSAAALAQPGTFDPSIMDSQRFSGVNLFAVLPGALPEREIFEELVHAARQLAERLNGIVADQHGEELTAARITRLRQSLEAAPAARAPDGA